MTPPPRQGSHLPARSLATRVRERALSHLAAMSLALRNASAHDSITGDAGVVVSLTSFGTRLESVHLAIESIARGSVKPREIILWVDQQPGEFLPSPALSRLIGHGLQVRFCDDLGPHKKYLPYLESTSALDVPLVTADDDGFYPITWLADLLTAHDEHPDDVVCHRAHEIVVGADGIAPYAAWRACTSSRPAVTHLGVGVSGILYPPAFQQELRTRGREGFERVPKTDDLYLHWAAIRAGRRVRQVTSTPARYLSIPDTQISSLTRRNVSGTGNDSAIAELYADADVALLRDALAGVPAR
ncbi:glycosyltransferase [Frondihabitans australicus]|uniref:Glycosyl transferase family 2 n=1 Tax=Frondihabitans australicus TaxID=386892 RepID=A0A495IKA3_9MICO|nr:glycosyltransferase [Frondihabitans australicus]RKR76397.1 hypothetical protein C8E83_3570 [Frondihabitans australicus]